MRYATVTLTWPEERNNPVDTAFDESDEVAIGAIRDVEPAGPETYVELLEFRGEPERARALLADAPNVIEFAVSGRDGRGLAYVRARSVGLVDDLLSVRRDYEIVIDWPISAVGIEGARGFEVTAIGTNRAIQRAAAALPDDVALELRRVGEYEPETDPSVGLTTRQREIFEIAVREGYYRVPREATQRELAAELGLAPATVGEHLQRIESKLAAAHAASVR